MQANTINFLNFVNYVYLLCKRCYVNFLVDGTLKTIDHKIWYHPTSSLCNITTLHFVITFLPLFFIQFSKLFFAKSHFFLCAFLTMPFHLFLFKAFLPRFPLFTPAKSPDAVPPHKHPKAKT